MKIVKYRFYEFFQLYFQQKSFVTNSTRLYFKRLTQQSNRGLENIKFGHNLTTSFLTCSTPLRFQTLLTNNPKRNVSGNSDTTSGCESGGPSCEDSDEAEEAINCTEILAKTSGNRSKLVVGSRSNSANSFNKAEGHEEDEDEDDEAETPKAVDNLTHVRHSPPPPPPLKQQNYVMSLPVQMMAVRIPSQASSKFSLNPIFCSTSSLHREQRSCCNHRER